MRQSPTKISFFGFEFEFFEFEFGDFFENLSLNLVIFENLSLSLEIPIEFDDETRIWHNLEILRHIIARAETLFDKDQWVYYVSEINF